MTKAVTREWKWRLSAGSLFTLALAGFMALSLLPGFGAVFATILAGCVGIALWEFFQMAKAKGFQPVEKVGIFSAVLLVYGLYFSSLFPQWQDLPALLLLFSFFASSISFFFRGTQPLMNIALTLFGVLYIGLALGLLVKIRYFTLSNGSYIGFWWVVYTITVTKMGDVGGLFIGRRIGKHKLAPALSPAKTIEGAVGALAASLLTSLAVCYFYQLWGNSLYFISYTQSVWLGLFVGVFGILGDLVESLLKRDADVKDSNRLPGLGGVLDMVDSMLFTTPLIYLTMRLMTQG